MVEISNQTLNFIKWMTENTESIQSNVRRYKGKMYFMDRDTENGRPTDGGIKDLWNVYINEILG